MSNTEFKAGDKVRRLKQNQGGFWNHGNQILTVKRTTTLDLYFEGMVEGWSKKRFELVAPAEPSFEEQLRYAKSLIGKKVFYTGQNPFVVYNVFVATEQDMSKLSDIVNNYIRANEWCVVIQGKRSNVHNNIYSNVYFPVTAIKLAPEFTECLHEGQLIAKIYDDKVEMSGTQFTHDEIKKLAKLLP